MTVQLTGFADFKQDTLGLDACPAQFVPGVFENWPKVFASFSVKQKMRPIIHGGSAVRCAKLILALSAVAWPALVAADWQLVASEQGKRVEIDRASIVTNEAGKETTAKGRIVLDKSIVDPKTSSAYRIIEVMNRYDCAERTYSTLKRSYFKEDGALVRQEEVRVPFDMPVRSGTPDDKLLREVCRPKSATPSLALASKTAEKVSAAAGALRRENEALVEKQLQKEQRAVAVHAASPASHKRNRKADRPANVAWSYEGDGAAENWSRLKASYATCGAGRRQSPIDLRDAIAVDLEPIQFAYWPVPYRVVDAGSSLQVDVRGASFALLGKNYELMRIVFHRPSEITVGGKAFEMEAQLVHQADDGKLAIVVVLLESGVENPLIQMVLNNLPLEKGGEVAPPGQGFDVAQLLPESRRYFTFMGSLTTPPCAEDVLWLVLKQPQQLSPEQLAIFQRLYKPNARPVQPGFGRIVKESR
ncbi:MAG: Carbonate dehydratase [Proteobacteria bacterium]|nr:Carbonate dehydratase [Pseudomonadota bacterium]